MVEKSHAGVFPGLPPETWEGPIVMDQNLYRSLKISEDQVTWGLPAVIEQNLYRSLKSSEKFYTDQ